MDLYPKYTTNFLTLNNKETNNLIKKSAGYLNRQTTDQRRYTDGK